MMDRMIDTSANLLSVFCVMHCSKGDLVCVCVLQIEELCQQIEDRDDALTKAREAAHKAQLQRYQASHEHQ